MFNYIDSAITWQEHTNTVQFWEALLTVTEDATLDNDARSAAMEAFLLDQALKAGVVKKVSLVQPRNPNKLGKALAPWFTEECRAAKRELVRARREHGRDDARYDAAVRQYKHTCWEARAAFGKEVPAMLKYQPKKFWRMFQKKVNTDNDVDAQAFASFN